MILEEEQIQRKVEKLKGQIEIEKKLIEMAEPFEMLIENDYFKKIQGYYNESANIYQRKIEGLNNDLVSDGAQGSDGGLSENPVFHQIRISAIITKAIMARDTLLSFVNEPKQIIERAKLSQENIEKLTAEIAELQEKPNATGE